MTSKNLSYSLIETQNNDGNTENVTYEHLLKKVNEESKNFSESVYTDMSVGMDDYVALELDYKENFTKKQLDRIADYYQIPKRRKKKIQLIEEIVIFEKDLSNTDITERRKILWFYVEEIKNDNYLSKFLILD